MIPEASWARSRSTCRSRAAALDPRFRQLRAVISWARYAEAFAYDEDSGVFSLDNPN